MRCAERTKDNMRFSDKIKGYTGENPFSANQARTFADRKVYKEFYPISLFWSLFNDQHEVLLGSRGSGKTFLLRMMRYSMLKQINHPKAKQLVKNKDYISLYVPLRLEFVVQLRYANLSEYYQMIRFQEGFNCLLSASLINEIEALLEEISDYNERISKQITIAQKLEVLWFGQSTGICELRELLYRVNQYYYSIDWKQIPNENSTSLFHKQICYPLMAARDLLAKEMNLINDPTWIVCIDEAEFLNTNMQKCINTFFRSDSNRIALKIATLPFYHITLGTLDGDHSVSEGNDFCYRIVDLKVDGSDFVELTNALCKHRLKEHFSSEEICNTVEEFVGVIGNDFEIDYYREEVGEENATKEVILSKIIESFNTKRKNNADQYSEPRKSLYDRFAPDFYAREMKKLSGVGNHTPGWYAGARIIREVSQGNPRLFIQIMNVLFEKARSNKLTPKIQHREIYKFANSICKSTKSLEKYGPDAYNYLDQVATKLSSIVHGEYLVAGGNTFTVSYQNDIEFEKAIKWIQLSVAHSRIIVDDESKRSGITKNTRMILCNAYCISYWIPMRSESVISIKLQESQSEDKRRKKNSNDDSLHQISIEEVLDNGDNK